MFLWKWNEVDRLHVVSHDSSWFMSVFYIIDLLFHVFFLKSSIFLVDSQLCHSFFNTWIVFNTRVLDSWEGWDHLNCEILCLWVVVLDWEGVELFVSSSLKQFLNRYFQFRLQTSLSTNPISQSKHNIIFFGLNFDFNSLIVLWIVWLVRIRSINIWIIESLNFILDLINCDL